MPTSSRTPTECGFGHPRRRAAPLVQLFFLFLRKGQAVRVLGRKEIGTGMDKALKEATLKASEGGSPCSSLDQIEGALRESKRDLEKKQSESLDEAEENEKQSQGTRL